MPKITAATVAEHRANQRDALLAAARHLLVTQGPHAVTPAAIGERAGLARSSVYKYFDSTAGILAEVVEDGFPRWAEAVRATVDAQRDPRSRIVAYLRANLDLVANGEHRLATALASVELPPRCRDRLQELHRDLTAPLVDALADLGTADPEVLAALVQGVIDAATRLIEAGAPADRVIASALALVEAGLTSTHTDDPMSLP